MQKRNGVAVVTGAAGSIGKAICKKLADSGCGIAVCDVDQTRAEAVAKEINEAGGNARAFVIDVTDSSAVNEQMAGIVEIFGGVDILVNCAGGSARERASIFNESSEDVWDWVINVNLKGARNLCRAAIGHMIASGYGRIINITSIIGVQGKAGHADYAAAKGGVIAFTKSLAMEAGKHGVTANCVSPGLVPRGDVDDEFGQRNSYLGTVCTPEHIAGLVCFLTTEEGGYVTGQNYIIDGGRSLGLKGD